MLRRPLAGGIVLGLLLLLWAYPSTSQVSPSRTTVLLTVIDENSVPVPDARVSISQPGAPPLQLQTDYAGRCTYPLQQAPYQIQAEKPGFYQAIATRTDAHLEKVEVVLAHQQIVHQEVSVLASPAGIDPEQTAGESVMNLPEIVNIPYQPSRDIRYILPYNPGVVPDPSGQVHLAGSPTYATLDLLDGFDIRSPVSGNLALRVSPDAVRSITTQLTRYPVEFGRATGGVVALYTGMGDNKFRFNATDFIPSFREINGVRLDKFAPRVTFSGPLVRNRAWFFDGGEGEYDNIYIQELPLGADTNRLTRISNLFKSQVNLTSANILSGGLLFNDYHSPYDGLSSLVPQQSTTKRDTVGWLPYLRDQHTFANGAVFDAGFGFVHIRDGYEPYGNIPYQLTPETSLGSYFENETAHSQREQFTASLYLRPRHWAGRHDLKAGVDIEHISFDETVSRAPVNYLREDGTLLRQSVFPAQPSFGRNNVETAAYLQDRWLTTSGLLIESGLRFDWDEIIRRPLFSPRIALAYSPPGAESKTKISAGIGLYYEHSQLEYLTRALAGIRFDTYFSPNGTTTISPPLETNFQANCSSLTEARTLNWSLGIEQKLPGQIFAAANFLQKHTSDAFIYANQAAPAALYGTYQLTNAREDHYNSFEIEGRRTFANGYTLFASYTRSSARTNAAVDYIPTLSLLGPQQSAPLPWDTPNRLISWGWLPLPLPKLKKSWDIVYTIQWQTGRSFTSIDANHQVVGAPDSMRFPDYLSFSPGLEWRFHLRGAYFGLRGVVGNATDRANPAIVNNVVDSPAYGTFTEPFGRSFTARLRLIGSK
jgi:hypothetical protein